ncbi:MAG: glycosyl hydrolase 108 family protein, partial [Candidatus Thermoplasmatota archaeon]|nr:glycosyl hydrolase 108 family protein [Candidatus Thermoplasmatota archaeon]
EVNDPDDPGGHTKYGISARAYPDVDIAELTREDAGEIYRKDYWDACHCNELAHGIDITVFDAAVNTGTKQATKFLQRALGVTADGIIGPLTLSAAELSVLQPLHVIADIQTERAEFLCDIVDNRAQSMKYLTGWLRRTTWLTIEATNLATAH